MRRREPDRIALKVLPALQHAQAPMTARELSKKLGVDEMRMRKSLGVLNDMGLLGQRWRACNDYRTHHACQEGEYWLRDDEETK